MKYTREQIQQTVENKGYKYFHDNLNKGYDVNIIMKIFISLIFYCLLELEIQKLKVE